MSKIATIIVPTFKRQDLFIRCLDSLANQDYEKERYEVIAVHDGLVCDYDKQIIDAAATQLKISDSKKTAHGGVSRARNHVIALAKGEFILMLDDDCEAKKDWVKTFIEYMEKHPEVIAAGGTILSTPPQTFIQRYINFKNLLRRPIFASDGEIIVLITANACFRRSIIDRVGGFREELTYSGGEDLDLSYRCRKFGMLSYCEKAIVYHHHRGSVKELVRQHILYGRGVYRACRYNNIDSRVLKFYDPTFWGLFKYFYYVLKRIFTVSLPEFRNKNLPLKLYLPYCFLDATRKISFIIGAAIERARRGRLGACRGARMRSECTEGP